MACRQCGVKHYNSGEAHLCDHHFGLHDFGQQLGCTECERLRSLAGLTFGPTNGQADLALPSAGPLEPDQGPETE
jgi:hypothetical protein